MTGTKAKNVHPFIYGRPVQPNEFLNRQADLRTIYNRLRKGESTAVVGEPHIGKSSLLLKLADKATQQNYLGVEVHGLSISLLNLHYISRDYSPTIFWKRAFKPLQQCFDQVTVTQCLQQIVQTGYTDYSIEEFFEQLNKQGQRLVLLLDEFECLLSHPNFQDFSFFAALRALDSFPSFSFVTTSRLSLSELNRRGHKLPGSGGSPLFNTQIELRLRPFSEEAIDILLSQADPILTLDDRRFICRMAGHHPFLIQAMAAALLETAGDNRYTLAVERFYGWISSHFDDLWLTLDDQARTTAVFLCLAKMGSETLERYVGHGEIDRMDAIGAGLRRLDEIGLARRLDEGDQLGGLHPFSWQGEKWIVGTEVFRRWVQEVVIAGTRKVESYDEWLTNKRYSTLLTQKQWETLIQATRYILDPAQLRHILSDYFSKSELHNLSFDLGVDFDDLPGVTKGDKARELVAHLERRGRIPELIQACQVLRPNVTW